MNQNDLKSRGHGNVRFLSLLNFSFATNLLWNLGVLKNVYLFTISIAKYKHRYSVRRGKFHLPPKRNKTLILCEKELCESISPHKYTFMFLSFMLRFHSFYNFKYWIVFLLVVNSTVRRPDEWHFETSGNYAPGGVWKSKDERKWLPGNSAGSYWICQQHSIERPVCIYRFGTWNCWESTRKAMS